MKSLSRVQLFATPWTAAYQAPPPMGFSRQEYWSGLPLPSPMTNLLLLLLLNHFSCVRLLATPWTAAYQAPPSMGFSRQEYWSGYSWGYCWPNHFPQTTPLPNTVTWGLGVNIWIWGDTDIRFIATIIKCIVPSSRAFLVAQMVKNPPAMQETWVQSLGWEDPLEKGKATYPAWRIPWTEEPGRL